MSDPAARLARQRIQLERALIRFVIDRRIVPLSVVARFLDLADDDEPLRSLEREDVSSIRLGGHYGALAAIELYFGVPTRHDLEVTPDPIVPPGLTTNLDPSSRGTEVAPNLLRVIGDRRPLFQLVARHSVNPQEIWDIARTIVDGSETVH